MAKRKSKKRRKFDVRDENEFEEIEFTNSDGFTVILGGLAPLDIQAVINSVEQPEKPTYDAELAGGGIETLYHDEESIKGDPEAEKLWAAYEEKQTEAGILVTEKVINTVLLDGVTLPEELPIPMSRWISRQKLKGVEFPKDENGNDDADSVELAFKTAYVVKHSTDATNLLELVMELTGVSKEVLDEAKESFPDQVEPDASDGRGDTTTET